MITVEPRQIIADDFIPIVVKPTEFDGALSGRFNIYNPYTYICLIYENDKTTHQLLFQTSFRGKVVFLAVSKLLLQRFGKIAKPESIFISCPELANAEMISAVLMEVLIGCMMEKIFMYGR